MEMKKLKIVSALAASALVILSVSSCGADVVTGRDGMLGYIRDYYSNDQLVMNASTYDRSENIVWVTSESGLAGYCIAATFRLKSDNKYEFVRMESPAEAADGIWECRWHGGTAVFVNNPDCRQVCYSDGENTMTVDILSIPADIFTPFNGGNADAYLYYYDAKGRKL